MSSFRDLRIKCAAIRYNGKLYEGRNHAEIGNRMVNEGVCPRPFPFGDDQGFATECGRYARRTPAMAIALGSGLVVAGKTINSRHLFSEDFEPAQDIEFQWGVDIAE